MARVPPPGQGTDLQRRALLWGGLCLPVIAWWPAAAAGLDAVPSRRRGSHRIDARDMGATGNGVSDDTDALQRAIDALPDAGGTVHVPTGRYAIDATRKLRLRSRMHLELAPDAELLAIPNAAERAYVVLVQDAVDVEVSGGRITGDRRRHLGSGGEWGHGLTVRGASRVTIRDLRITDCWGDGISIGSNPARRGHAVAPSEDVVVARVICSGNRRQGLTVGRSRRVRVLDSEFSDTHGTAPAAGIDVEPDSGDPPDNTGARDVVIERCLVRGNRGPGIQLYKRVRGVRIADCRLQDNGNCGVLVVAAKDVVIESNTLGGNRRHAIDVQQGSRGLRVDGNRFASGMPWRERIHVSRDSSAVTFGGNNREG
jgi:polygalacturonase